MNIYEELYKTEAYYWGFKPSDSCFRVLKDVPPTKPLRLLDIGCGEGRNAVFFARNGYDVTAFDAVEAGVEKTKRLAEKLGVHVNAFQADIRQFRLDEKFDILFSSGVLHYLPEALRGEVFENYRAFTNEGGAHMFSVFVRKPFVPDPPERENYHPWISGELFTHYAAWKIDDCVEEIFDCQSSGMPHQHAVNRVLARKPLG